jgi:hypothetical protein
MSDGPTATPANTKHLLIIGYLLSLTLIFTFLWRTLTVANEYPPRSTQLFEMGLDILMVAGLFGVKSKIPAALFWIALVAGLGVLAIRFHSDASWWTGHWNYALDRR